MKYVRYIIFIAAIALFYFSIKEQKVSFPSGPIKTQIDKKLPIKITKKEIDILVTNIILTPNKEDLNANIELDIKYLNLSLKKVKASATGNIYIKGREIYVKLKDINIEKLNIEDNSLKDISEKAKEAIEKTGFFKTNFIKSSFISTMAKKVKDKTIDFTNDHSEKISEIITSNISNIPVFKLKDKKYYFLKDLTIRTEGEDFFIEGLITFGWPGIILSVIIGFLSIARELGLLLIHIYQKYFSRRKSYCCAKGLEDGEDTCSESVRKVFKEKGFISGINQYFESKEKCKEIYNSKYKNSANSTIGTASFLEGGAEMGLEAVTAGESGACACEVGSC